MGRPRGFIENWNPRPDTKALVRRVADIIEESEILPLTLRQIFYMMVSQHGYDKTEKAYKRLCETMNKARRARYIEMEDIRDDGLTRVENAGWSSRTGFLENIKQHAFHFRLDRQARQPKRIYVWCEAGGMVPQLAQAMEEYQVPVLSSGGFDSVTTKHNFAEEISEHQEALIFHLGDHDPSGVHMFGSLDEDLQAFVDWYGGDVEMRRIAVTPTQVERLSLPTAPAKPTDNRAFSGRTTQCEAIPPRELRKIVLANVEPEIDMDIHEQTIDEERGIGAELTDKFDDLI